MRKGASVSRMQRSFVNRCVQCSFTEVLLTRIISQSVAGSQIWNFWRRSNSELLYFSSHFCLKKNVLLASILICCCSVILMTKERFFIIYGETVFHNSSKSSLGCLFSHIFLVCLTQSLGQRKSGMGSSN
jgi:hypothetical protein